MHLNGQPEPIRSTHACVLCVHFSVALAKCFMNQWTNLIEICKKYLLDPKNVKNVLMSVSVHWAVLWKSKN